MDLIFWWTGLITWSFIIGTVAAYFISKFNTKGDVKDDYHKN